MVFVMDIQIYPEFRRKGYAQQAFLEMEKQALDLDINMIALHVFKHNVNARNMYEKLGYEGDNANMMKVLKKE